jgi:hypothetical protein
MIDGLASQAAPTVASLRQFDRTYRGGYVAGLVQAAMLERDRALSHRIMLASAVYGAALADDTTLARIERGPREIQQVHWYGLGAASLDGFELTGHENLSLLAWLASWTGLDLTPEVLARESLRRMAYESAMAGLRTHMESALGILSKEVTIACAAYRLALGREDVELLLASEPGGSIDEVHRIAWGVVERLGLALPEPQEALIRSWLTLPAAGRRVARAGTPRADKWRNGRGPISGV